MNSTTAEETAEGQFPKLSLQTEFLLETPASTYPDFHFNLLSSVGSHCTDLPV